MQDQTDQPVISNTNDFYAISAQQTSDNSASPKNKKVNFAVMILPLLLALVGISIYILTRRAQETTETRTRADVEQLRLTLSASADAQDGNVSQNEEFTVSVLAANEGAFQIAAASVSASFTRNNLQLLSYEVGTFFSSAPDNLINKTNFVWTDPVNVALANTRGALAVAQGAYCTTQAPWQCFPQTQSGILLTLRFRATQNGVASIQLTNAEAADITNCNPDTPEGLIACSTNIAAVGTPAQLQITVGENVTATATTTTSPTATATTAPIATATTTTSPTATATTAPTATATVSPTPAAGTVSKNIVFTLQAVTTHRRDATASVILKQNEEIIHQEIVTGTNNANGVYTATVHNITPGTYTVYLKGPSHLARKLPNNVEINAESPEIDFSATPLLVGDLVGNPLSSGGQDGIFNIVDFQPFIFIFRTGSSHLISEYPDRQNTDLNMDGVIDITDMIPMISNYRNHIYEEDR